MKIAIGADHAGFSLKGAVLEAVRALGHEVEEFPCYDERPVDFPDVARTVCDALRNGTAERAILVCGTGVGASIAANKIPGIRAAMCHDVHSAHQAVEHDDVNVMCIGAKIVGPWLAVDLVQRYLAAEFGTDEDCRRRVEKLHALEREFAGGVPG